MWIYIQICISSLVLGQGSRPSSLALVLAAGILELTNLHVNELLLDRLTSAGVIDIRPCATKTTDAGDTTALLLRGDGAHLMAEWLRVAEIETGFVFRKITRL